MGINWSNFQVIRRKKKITWLMALSKRISKYNLFQGSPNFEGETAGKFREMGNNRDIYGYANQGVVNLEREYQSPTTLYQNPCNAWTFLYNRPNFRKKNEKKPLNFQAKIWYSFMVLPFQNIGRIQKVFISPNILCYRLKIPKNFVEKCPAVSEFRGQKIWGVSKWLSPCPLSPLKVDMKRICNNKQTLF